MRAYVMFFRPPKLFVPGGQTFLTHRRGGDKHFSHTAEGGTNIFQTQGRRQTFFKSRGGQTSLDHGGINIFTQEGRDKHFMLEAVVALMMMMRRLM